MAWQLNGNPDDNQLFARDISTTRLQKVHYVEAGNPEGGPVVLLHDNLADSRWWEATQEQMAYRYRSLALDLRGYGQTEYKPADSLRDFAEDLAEFVEALSLDKIFLVGWGMGGGVAMQYAIEHPEKLAALCLVNSIGPKGHDESNDNGRLGEIALGLRNNRPDVVATYLRRNYFRSGNFPIGDTTEGGDASVNTGAGATVFDYLLQGSLLSRNFSDDSQAGIFRAMRNFDVHKALGKLECPVFNIVGDSDPVIDHKKETAELRAVFNEHTNYDDTTIPFCGHSPMIEQVSQFRSVLDGYIGRLNYQQTVHPSTVSPALRMKAMDTTGNQPDYGDNAVSDIAYQNPNP